MSRRKRRSKRPLPTNPTLTGVLNPDGVGLYIDWKSFEPGMSIFIPAVDTVKLKDQVEKLTRNRGFKVKGIERIEGGLLGMRFWRMS